MTPLLPNLLSVRQPLVTPELIEHHCRIAHDLRNAEIRRAFGRCFHMLALPLHALNKLRKSKKEERPCVSTI